MQKNLPFIKSKLVFLKGKRQTVPNLRSGKYRPHIVIGDTNQREPITQPGTNMITETYLGIVVTEGPESFNFEDEVEVKMVLAYFGTVDYHNAQIGQTFTLREGGNIVGYGKIIDRKDPFTQ